MLYYIFLQSIAALEHCGLRYTRNTQLQSTVVQSIVVAFEHCGLRFNIHNVQSIEVAFEPDCIRNVNV